MTDEEKIVLAKSGLYCALTGEDPAELMKDVMIECEEINNKIIQFVDEIKCSELARVTYITTIKNALIEVKKNITGVINGSKL